MPNEKSGKPGKPGKSGKGKQGFASMSKEKRSEIARKGGKAAHAKGTAHKYDASEAREAGRLGGEAVSKNREHMAEIGRRGGTSKHRNKMAKKAKKDGETDAE